MLSRKANKLFKDRAVTVTERDILVGDAEYIAFFVGITMRGKPKQDYVIIDELDYDEGYDYSVVVPSGVDSGEGEIYTRSSSMDSVTFNEMINDWLFKSE